MRPNTGKRTVQGVPCLLRRTGRAHHEDRHLCAMDDILRDAPKKEVGHRTLATGAEHHEVGPRLRSQTDDLLAGPPLAELLPDPDPRRLGELLDRRERPLAILAELAQRLIAVDTGHECVV